MIPSISVNERVLHLFPASASILLVSIHGLLGGASSISIRVSVSNLYGYNADEMDLFTVIPSISINICINIRVPHPFPASAFCIGLNRDR